MDCFTLAFGRIIEYKFPTGLAETTATLAPLPDKGSLARHFFRVLLFSFFNPSLHHSLPLLEERYCLSPYRNYLKNVEEGKRKKKKKPSSVSQYGFTSGQYSVTVPVLTLSLHFLIFVSKDANRSFL